MRKTITNIVFAIISTSLLAQNSNPPLMGWASWNNYRVNISDSIIKRQADFLVSTGLKEVGYQYINIDDGFFDGRAKNGDLKINHQRFPKGMKSIAEYIHSKGLKAGIYSDIGPNTCASIWDKDKGGVGAGLYRNEERDLDKFINDWGYDFIKIDYCGASQQNLKLDEETHYTQIARLLKKIAKKPVIYNICRWQFPGPWVTTTADSWRISGDIANNFKSMLHIVDLNTFLAPYMSPGHYNDMDMLQIGRGMTTEQDRAQFSMWSILSSPLLLGNDLSSMSPETLSIISNQEVIAVNQDVTEQGKLISDYKDSLQVWAKKLNGKQSGEIAVVLLNRTKEQKAINFKFQSVGLRGKVKVRDLWKHTDLGLFRKEITMQVPATGTVMLTLKGKPLYSNVYEAEYAYLNNYNLTRNTKVIEGLAKPIFFEKASKKAVVENIGKSKENYLEFREVYAPKKGKYALKIYYFTNTACMFEYSVNNKRQKKDSFPKATNGGGKLIWVDLEKGYNRIRFNNAQEYLPKLDKIEVRIK